ncbi:MAG: hypothetical protein WCH43_12895 [Verrucomicrobiota bacterium]
MFMNRILIFSVLAFIVLASNLCHALPNNRENYELAIAEAKRDGKVLGIYFDKPGSDACLALKWRLIGKDRFEALSNGDLVYLMIQDRGSNPKGERLMSEADVQLENQFSVTSYPVFILLSPDGKAIDRIDGYNWHEDPQADKYYERIVAAIKQGKTQADKGSIPGGSNVPSPIVKNSPVSSVRIFDGDVLFAFGDGARLVSHRTIEVTGDKNLMKLDSTDYFVDEKLVKYVSRLLMKGVTNGNTFNSADQQPIKTDYSEWVPENISIEFSPDGDTAMMTSVYQISTGRVVGKGVLKLKPKGTAESPVTTK